MSDRFVRQAELVPRDKLAEEHVTVIGVGAIGRQVTVQLASIGVPRLTLIDFDVVDESNLTTQGYRHREIGISKVTAARQAALEIDPSIKIETVNDRFRGRHRVSNSVFCCVDSISAREAIWRQISSRTKFWCDGRMLGEVIRVLTVCDFYGREHYPRTLFSQAEAQVGACTSRSTVYAAAITAGLMVHQYTRSLRTLTTDSDLSLNLLSGELTAA
jgi:molybdopterin-synthase adenylyltransferase